MLKDFVEYFFFFKYPMQSYIIPTHSGSCSQQQQEPQNEIKQAIEAK